MWLRRIAAAIDSAVGIPFVTIARECAIMADLGRYEVGEILGQGGFATVHRAHDPVLDRDIAIKLLHPHLAHDPQIAERFVREGRALARIRHPNLVQVFDAGELDSKTFIAMEYISGRSLAALGAGRQMPLSDVASIMEQVAGAIGAVHAAGLIHRDIKPANIIVETSGRAVLLDLGIARDMENSSVTATGLVVGTPGFLAPEQVDSSVFVGPQTDIYQLAATAYTLLAGKPPYEGDTARVLYAVAHQPPPDLGAVRPDLPYHAINAIARGLAKDPSQRPHTATEFAAALKGVAPATEPTLVASTAPATLVAPPGVLPTAVAPVPGPALAADDMTRVAPAVSAAVPSGVAADTKQPRAKSRLPILVAGGVLSLAVVAAAAFFLLGDGDEPAEADPDAQQFATGDENFGDIQPDGEPGDYYVPGGEPTRLLFRAPASGVVSLVLEKGGVEGYYRFVDATGNKVGREAYLQSSGGIIDSVTLKADERYEIEIEAEKSGTSTLALFEVPIPEPVAIAPAGPPLEVSVTVPGGKAFAAFDAPAGMRLSIQVTGATAGFYLAVASRTDPSQVARSEMWVNQGDTFVDVFEIPRAGKYAISVDPDKASLVRATLNLYSVGADKVRPIVEGTPIQLQTSNPGENAEFTFRGKKDQIVAVRLSRVASGSYLAIRRSIEGRELERVWAGAGSGALLLATLPADDDYAITVDPYLQKLETATISLSDVSRPATATIEVGGAPVTVSTSAPGQKATLLFQGTGGQSLTLRSKSRDGAYVTLIGPNGNELVKRQWMGLTDSVSGLKPVISGPHVIVLEPNTLDTASYTVDLIAQ